jgi:hypothetical protein
MAIIPAFENMDLTELKDKQFLISILTSKQDDVPYVSSLIKGPFSFYEMAEVCGDIWENKNRHPFVIIASKEFSEKIQYLDEDTIDYLESRWKDIVVDGFIEDILQTDYTCKAGVTTYEQKQKEEPNA